MNNYTKLFAILGIVAAFLNDSKLTAFARESYFKSLLHFTLFIRSFVT